MKETNTVSLVMATSWRISVSNDLRYGSVFGKLGPHASHYSPFSINMGPHVINHHSVTVTRKLLLKVRQNNMLWMYDTIAEFQAEYIPYFLFFFHHSVSALLKITISTGSLWWSGKGKNLECHHISGAIHLPCKTKLYFSSYLTRIWATVFWLIWISGRNLSVDCTFHLGLAVFLIDPDLTHFSQKIKKIKIIISIE